MAEHNANTKTLAHKQDDTTIRKLIDLKQKRRIERETKNATTRRSSVFLEACKAARVEPTPRQASKFKNEFGAAYAAR